MQLGYVFSAMLIGYALFQTVGGRLADRFGPRRVLTAGVVWWGIFTGLTALVPATSVGRCFCLSPSAFFWVRGRQCLSLVEPICSAMDSGARARHRQRLDFCRSRRGRRPFATVDYLLHACTTAGDRPSGHAPLSAWSRVRSGISWLATRPRNIRMCPQSELATIQSGSCRSKRRERG